MINQNTTRTKKPWFVSAADVVQGNSNETIELNSPSLRFTFEENYGVILAMFVIIVIMGTSLNALEIYFIIKNKFHKDATNVYFLNLAVTDIVKCIIVIPFSMLSLLFQNWILGEFLCYFLPMLQDVPAHVTLLTFVMIVFDRYLFVRNPAKARLPGIIFSIGAWLTAICIALPYPIYTTYLDLEAYSNLSHVAGSGVCIYGVDKAIKEYSRGLFVGMFIIPLVVIGVIFIQIFQYLQEQDQPIVVEGNEIRLRATFRRYYSIQRFNRGILSNQTINRESCSQTRTENNSIADQFDIDPKEEEKRLQIHLVSMVAAFSVCFAPLNSISKVIFVSIHETYEISAHLDKLFVICCWIAFLPTIITPLLVFSTIMNDEDKNILKNYFRKRRRSVCDRSLELEENFPNVAYISHPSATTLSTDVGSQPDRSFSKTRN